MNNLSGLEIGQDTLNKHGCDKDSYDLEFSCVLLITVFDLKQIHTQSFDIELTVNTGIRYLIEGDYTFSSIPPNSVNYYEFEVINDVDQIEVQLNLWSKEGVLISVLRTDELTIDTDFRKGATSSQLENRVVIKKQTPQDDLTGNYIVAVFSSEEQLSYSISYTLGSKKSY